MIYWPVGYICSWSSEWPTPLPCVFWVTSPSPVFFWMTSPLPCVFWVTSSPPLCFLGDLPLPCVFWVTHWPAGCICSWSSEWPPLPWNDDTTSSAYGHCVGCYRSRWTSGNSSQATTITSQLQTPQEPIQIISALSSRSVSCTTHPVDNTHTKSCSNKIPHSTVYTRHCTT